MGRGRSMERESRLEGERADVRAAMEACEGGEIECARCHEYYEADEIVLGPRLWVCHSCDALATQPRISKL